MMLQKITRQLNRVAWCWDNFKRIMPDSQLIPEIFNGPITYQTDSLITSNNCDFIADPRFMRAYQAALQTDPGKDYDLPWRVYMVCALANQVKGLRGDFVECGVYTGAFSRAVIEYTGFTDLNKTFYL